MGRGERLAAARDLAARRGHEPGEAAAVTLLGGGAGLAATYLKPRGDGHGGGGDVSFGIYPITQVYGFIHRVIVVGKCAGYRNYFYIYYTVISQHFFRHLTSGVSNRQL